MIAKAYPDAGIALSRRRIVCTGKPVGEKKYTDCERHCAGVAARAVAARERRKADFIVVWVLLLYLAWLGHGAGICIRFSSGLILQAAINLQQRLPTLASVDCRSGRMRRLSGVGCGSAGDPCGPINQCSLALSVEGMNRGSDCSKCRCILHTEYH
jgi:hypothetical protein